MEASQQVTIRSMLLSDVPQVYLVQSKVYDAHLLEKEEVFAAKIKFCPSGCFVAEDTEINSVIGYIISHPWKEGVKMELHTTNMEISSPDIYYVHDTAILQTHRKLNLGNKLYAKALERCKSSQYSKIKLVALSQAIEYWERHGFKQDMDDSGHPASYGEVYPMSLSLLPSKHLADSF